MNGPRHFLDLDCLDGATLRGILDEAAALKASRPGNGRARAHPERPLDGKLLAMIFEKPSTRTRVSFDVGMRQIGGQTITLNAGDMELARGETFGSRASSTPSSSAPAATTPCSSSRRTPRCP